MATARLTPEDILTPRGDIQSDVIFPGVSAEDVRIQLGGWLSDVYQVMLEANITLATEAVLIKANRAARRWLYYKSYEYFFTRLAASPLQAEVANEASQRYDAVQISEFRRLKDAYLADYMALFADLTPVAEAKPVLPISTTVRNTFVN